MAAPTIRFEEATRNVGYSLGFNSTRIVRDDCLTRVTKQLQ
jgi:hypothetical protein